MKFREELKNLKRIVVKVGSNVITRKNGKLDTRKLRVIVEDISELVENKVEVVFVSSGAVAVGTQFLKKHMPRKGRIDLQQSASSIGQPKLLNIYSRLFDENDKICSQILLTHDDFKNRKRFLHAKQTIEVLLRNKIIPILNENDSISFSEITVGDNDHLAAQAAQMVEADALLVITSEKGLYDKDPSHKDSKFIEEVKYNADLCMLDMESKTSAGRGGMQSKVNAIQKVTHVGIKGLISSKKNNRIVMDPLTKKMGTYFHPEETYKPEHRKAWLITTKKQFCHIEIDEGAYEALMQGKSLLPIGVVNVEGRFFKGDCVDIVYDGNAFAQGVSEYDAKEIKRIKDKHSKEISNILGFNNSNEIIHTTNLLINNDLKEGLNDDNNSKGNERASS